MVNAEKMAEEFLANNDTDKLEGLDIDEQNGIMSKVFKKKRLEDAQLFFRLFETEDGKKVLKKLIAMHVLRPVVNPGEDGMTVGIREGQKRLVLWIMNQIETARKG